MPHLVLENLTKRFGAVTAVDNVSLGIEAGEFFALLGPSGCGKTTAMRLVAGLEQAAGGSIFIGGKEVTRLPPRERNVAMVFQDYALYPHMTVLDNIGYPLKVRGVERKELVERVKSVGTSLQLEGLMDRRPSQLSGGQQQRAAVGRAVVHHAEVFLFDEPLSNLDAKLRHEARAFLKKLQRNLGVTTIFVTHDQAEAMALADRIGIMNEGKIVQVGTPVEVYRLPQTTFVANFLGSPPMNLLKVRYRQRAFEGQGFTLDASPWDKLLQGREGEALTLGVRPEHLQLCSEDTLNAISGEVYALEPLGPETLITLSVGGAFTVVRIFADEPPQVDGQAFVHFAPKHLHLFDATGKRI
jgi:ABC-type sugar transport system ATPase subunit